LARCFLGGDKPDARPTDCRRASGNGFSDPGSVALSTVIDHDDPDRRDWGINHANSPSIPQSAKPLRVLR
ncbi:MAG: hypothetical protein QOF70_6195, partial [Acetobacteraceae bacterium]|nr:hypothetical protein [Acetobacteraceae bacterium]